MLVSVTVAFIKELPTLVTSMMDGYMDAGVPTGVFCVLSNMIIMFVLANVVVHVPSVKLNTAEPISVLVLLS